MDSKANCVPLHGTTLNWHGLVNMPDPVFLLNVAPQCRLTGTALACASNRLSWARLLWYFSVQPKRLLKIPIPFCLRGVSSVCPKGSRKNNFPCLASIHPVWRRCSSFPYEKYAQPSRLARQVLQHPNMGSYSCANPTPFDIL